MLKRNLVIGLLVLGSFLGLGLRAAAIAPSPVTGEPARLRPAARVSAAATVERVTQSILPYVEGDRPDDSLIEVQAGVWVKSSNYRGVTIDGVVYYYAILPHQSFDPLSRGAVAPGAVEIVTEIRDRDFAIVIYRITNDATRVPGTST
jgi:hypothetical protein